MARRKRHLPAKTNLSVDEPSAEGRLSWRWTLLGMVALALLAFLPFLPVLRAEFLDWDDPYYITHNFRIHQLTWANVADLFRLNPQLGPIPNGQYTPLVELSLMIEHRLVGLQPWLYHLTNVLLHMANTLLVCAFLRKLRADRAWAWLTAALFAVHPLHVESVAWIVERKDVLCAFFCLGAMILYLDFRATRKTRYVVASLVAATCALLSKPMAVTLPAVLLLCDLYLGRPLSDQWKRPWLAPFAALSLLFTAITWHTHASYGIIRAAEAGNVFQNMTMASWNFFWFVGKTLWPLGLSAYVPVPPDTPATAVSYGLAFLGVLALVAGLGWGAWRRGLRLLPFGVFFFMVAFLPMSRLVPIGIRYMVADRFFYLPGIGFLLLMAHGFVQCIRSSPRGRVAGIAGAAALILFWAGLSFAQSRVWRNSETLWDAVLRRAPDAFVALNGKAFAHLNASRLDEAATYLARSLEVDPDSVETLALRARLAYRQGDLATAHRYLEAAEAKGLSPLMGADLKAKLLSLAGDHRGAILALSAYVEITSPAYWYYYKMAWEALHIAEEPKAILCLEQAQALMPPKQAALGRFLAQNDPEWLRQNQMTRLLAAGIDFFADVYNFSQEIHLWFSDRDRALKEYDLIITHFGAALDCWRRARAASSGPGPISSIEEKNFERKLGIVFYNRACILAHVGKHDAALESLSKALERDKGLQANARNDLDFAPVRDRPEFQALMQR
jgi:tetratricopeptide (TPR) repeat protein